MIQTRRRFLDSAFKGSTLLSLGLTVPTFLHRSALAASAAVDRDRILVVVQLSGGNDGLNTVIPFADELYKKNRVTLRIAEADVLKVTDGVGLHPSLAGFADLFESGRLSIVQGVGYPNPSRSHFRSMDIWQTASVAEKLPGDGWLGRAIRQPSWKREGTLPAVHFGNGRLPLALTGGSTEVPSLDSVADYKLQAGLAGRDGLQAIAATRRGDDTLQFLQRSVLDAYATSGRLEEMAARYETPVNYPASELARKLKLVAQLIDAGFGTRIFYASIDGFDTHANQLATHGNLLRELGDAVKAFLDDVSHHGHGDRVLLLTFSEFGRRVKENGSRGTDHGAAAPLFLCGKVTGGVVGAHPSLSDLDEGDLKHHTDFRNVYATVLEDWLGCPSREVLGGAFDRLPRVLAHS